MKTNNIQKILSFLTLMLLISSCIQDGEFEVPNITIEEPNILANSSITAVKTALIQEFNSNQKLTYTFFDDNDPATEPTIIEGYVVSSDAAGNFFRTLVIQDNPTNPTAGLEINLDNSTLSGTFEVGRKIYVLLDGLTVSYDDGESNANPTNNIPGKYVLGILNGGNVDDIPSTAIKNHIFRSSSIEQITPTPILLEDITETHVNTLIQLTSAQFLKSDLDKTFAGEPNDSFDGFRTIFECDTQATIPLQTSTFASFKSNIIPSGKGTITVVLSKDFRSEFLVAILNTPSDILFTEADRCDPPVLECNNTGTLGGNVVVYEQTFETIFSNANLTAAGFTNVNVNGGSELFEPASFSGKRYMQISAFRSGENPLEAWLVTPAINMENSTNEALTFDTNTGFDNGKALKAYVSSDFTGDVTTATWLEVDAKLSEGPSSGYGSNFTNSGLIDVSCLTGNIYIAFKYFGSDGGVTTTFQIDNIKVTGN